MSVAETFTDILKHHVPLITPAIFAKCMLQRITLKITVQTLTVNMSHSHITLLKHL